MARPARSSRDTRNDILDAALDLFASKGFAATTVRDIAARVGIKDASLYNHFASKQAIFDTALERELAYSPQADMPTELDDVLDLYRPFFEDTRLVRLRHVLTVNQFENAHAGDAFRRTFVERPLALLTDFVNRMAAAGMFAQCNARVAAYELHGSAFLMLAQNLPWSEAKSRLRAQLRAFEREHRA